MKYTILFTTTILLTLTTNSYLIGKVEARSQFGEAHKLVMEAADFVTILEIQESMK